MIGPLFIRQIRCEHGTFAVRRVNLLARLQLDFADGENMLGALVQELDDLRVQLVDGLAMIGDVHGVLAYRSPARIEG